MSVIRAMGRGGRMAKMTLQERAEALANEYADECLTAEAEVAIEQAMRELVEEYEKRIKELESEIDVLVDCEYGY